MFGLITTDTKYRFTEFGFCWKIISQLNKSKRPLWVCVSVRVSHELPQTDRIFALILRGLLWIVCSQSAALKELLQLLLFGVFGLKAVSSDSHDSVPSQSQCLSLCHLLVWHRLTRYVYMLTKSWLTAVVCSHCLASFLMPQSKWRKIERLDFCLQKLFVLLV